MILVCLFDPLIFIFVWEFLIFNFHLFLPLETELHEHLLFHLCFVKANRLTSPRATRHSQSSSDVGSFTGRLLTISPADELTFVADDSGKEIFDVITLSNTLMYPIAFKVRLCHVAHCLLSSCDWLCHGKEVSVASIVSCSYVMHHGKELLLTLDPVAFIVSCLSCHRKGVFDVRVHQPLGVPVAFIVLCLSCHRKGVFDVRVHQPLGVPVAFIVSCLSCHRKGVFDVRVLQPLGIPVAFISPICHAIEREF